MNTYVTEIQDILDTRTAELRLDLGFHLTATRRFAIERIRIYRNGSPNPAGGTATEATLGELADLLRDESLQLLATTRKNGGSGWSADLHLPDAGRTLNEELIDPGLAADYDSWLEQRRRSDVVRTAFDIGRDVRDELTARAKSDGKTPAQLLRHIVERFLNMEPGT